MCSSTVATAGVLLLRIHMSRRAAPGAPDERPEPWSVAMATRGRARSLSFSLFTTHYYTHTGIRQDDHFLRRRGVCEVGKLVMKRGSGPRYFYTRRSGWIVCGGFGVKWKLILFGFSRKLHLEIRKIYSPAFAKTNRVASPENSPVSIKLNSLTSWSLSSRKKLSCEGWLIRNFDRLPT